MHCAMRCTIEAFSCWKFVIFFPVLGYERTELAGQNLPISPAFLVNTMTPKANSHPLRLLLLFAIGQIFFLNGTRFAWGWKKINPLFKIWNEMKADSRPKIKSCNVPSPYCTARNKRRTTVAKHQIDKCIVGSRTYIAVKRMTVAHQSRGLDFC